MSEGEKMVWAAAFVRWLADGWDALESQQRAAVAVGALRELVSHTGDPSKYTESLPHRLTLEMSK